MSSRPSKDIFRKEALDQLSSPEQLDQLLEVVSRKSWIPIFGLAAVIGLALIWSLVGTIPVTVEGAGQLHVDGSLRKLPSPAAGQIATLDLSVDQEIQQGQQLGEIYQPALQQRREQETVRRVELKERYDQLLKLREKSRKNETSLYEKNRNRLTAQTGATQERADNLKERSARYLSELELTLTDATTNRDALDKDLKARLEMVVRLEAQGNAEPSEKLSARRDFMENKAARDDLRLRIQKIKLSRLESAILHQRQMELIAELKAEMQALQVEEEKSELLFQEFKLDSEFSINEATRNIKRIEKQLFAKGQINSVVAGRVLEVTGIVGQFVAKGQRLATICRESEDDKLVAFAYFDLKDGKKIEEGFKRRTIKAHITPTMVKRERFGSIIGKVISVSKFPVTTEAVETKVGNAEVARRLTAGGDKIQVVVELNPGPTKSGFEWTSGEGPDIEVTAGSNVIVRAIIEERTPISYIIPFLRELSGS